MKYVFSTTICEALDVAKVLYRPLKPTKLLEEAFIIKDLKQIKKHLAVLPDFLERVTLVYN